MSKHVYSRDLHSQVDRLLAQQCLVRRFRLEHPEEFFALARMRDELADALRDSGFGCMPPPFDFPIAHELASWFSVVEGHSGREAIRAGNDGRLADLLGSRELNHLREPSIEGARECLEPHLPFIEDFLSRFNYVEHAGMLSMTALCSGKTLAAEQARASSMPIDELFLPQSGSAGRKGREPPLPDDPELRLVSWAYRGAETRDLNLECAILASAVPQRFSSSSIEIYDSLENKIPEPNGARALYLRIDLKRAPAEIDDALLYLRSALTGLLIEEHRMLGRVPDNSTYAKTDFAQKAERLSSIATKRHSVRPTILGLWCWDLVALEKNSVAASAEMIQRMCAEWPDFPVPGVKDMETHYRRVKNLIVMSSKAKHGTVDKAISRRHDIRLGPRQNEKFPPETKAPPEDWLET